MDAMVGPIIPPELAAITVADNLLVQVAFLHVADVLSAGAADVMAMM